MDNALAVHDFVGVLHGVQGRFDLGSRDRSGTQGGQEAREFHLVVVERLKEVVECALDGGLDLMRLQRLRSASLGYARLASATLG